MFYNYSCGNGFGTDLVRISVRIWYGFGTDEVSFSEAPAGSQKHLRKGPGPSRQVSRNVTKQKLMKTMGARAGLVFHISGAPENALKTMKNNSRKYEEESGSSMESRTDLVRISVRIKLVRIWYGFWYGFWYQLLILTGVL